jgi:thiol-disulfide isomerase/thioredoxin
MRTGAGPARCVPQSPRALALHISDLAFRSSQAMLPTYKQLSETYGKLNFYKVDVDEHAQLSQEAGARVYPTFVVYSGGTQVRFNPEPAYLIIFF